MDDVFENSFTVNNLTKSLKSIYVMHYFLWIYIATSNSLSFCHKSVIFYTYFCYLLFAGDGWLCDKVVIKANVPVQDSKKKKDKKEKGGKGKKGAAEAPETRECEWYIPVNLWFDKGLAPDKKIVRMLTPGVRSGEKAPTPQPEEEPKEEPEEEEEEEKKGGCAGEMGQGYTVWCCYNLGLYSLRRRRLISIGIPIINLRRSSDRLRFIMGIPIPVRRHLLSE